MMLLAVQRASQARVRGCVGLLGTRNASVPGNRTARLLSSLAVLEQKDGALNHASLSAITAAQKLGGPVTALVAGSNIRSVANQVAKVEGLQKVIAIDNAAYDKVC